MKLLFILLSLLLFSCWDDNSENENTIIVGVSADFRPFEFVQNGVITGFDIDMMREIGKIIDKKVKFVDIEFAGLIGNLNNDKIDLIVSGMSSTPERLINMDFSQCYFDNYISAVYLASDHDIKSEQDLYNKKIGVQIGTMFEKYSTEIKKQHSGTVVTKLAKNSILIQELRLKRIDMIILDEVVAKDLCAQDKNFKYVALKNAEHDCYSIGFKKNSTLKNEINAALKELKQNGKLKELEDKWSIF